MLEHGGPAQETFADKVRRVVQEDVAIVPYDPCWAESFRLEAEHLRACLPRELVGRIEHFGVRPYRAWWQSRSSTCWWRSLS